MKKPPLQRVKDQFGNKADLVKAVQELASGDLWLDKLAEDDGLKLVSNAKLLRLHDVLGQVRDQFGSRKALIEAILKSEKREKDEGYAERLGRFPTPRLWDRYQTVK